MYILVYSGHLIKKQYCLNENEQSKLKKIYIDIGICFNK